MTVRRAGEGHEVSVVARSPDGERVGVMPVLTVSSIMGSAHLAETPGGETRRFASMHFGYLPLMMIMQSSTYLLWLYLSVFFNVSSIKRNFSQGDPGINLLF